MPIQTTVDGCLLAGAWLAGAVEVVGVTVIMPLAVGTKMLLPGSKMLEPDACRPELVD